MPRGKPPLRESGVVGSDGPGGVSVNGEPPGSPTYHSGVAALGVSSEEDSVVDVLAVGSQPVVRGLDVGRGGAEGRVRTGAPMGLPGALAVSA